MTFTTDVSFRIVFWSTSRFNLGLPDLWRKCWANKCQFDVVYFLQWDLNGPVMRFGSYCCDTDKRHIFDSTSKTSGIDLPQKTFPSVTTVHTQGIMRLLSHKHNSQAIKSPISLSHILWIKSVKYHICSQSWGTCTNQPPTETQFKHFCDKSWWFYLAFSLFYETWSEVYHFGEFKMLSFSQGLDHLTVICSVWFVNEWFSTISERFIQSDFWPNCSL